MLLNKRKAPIEKNAEPASTQVSHPMRNSFRRDNSLTNDWHDPMDVRSRTPTEPEEASNPSVSANVYTFGCRRALLTLECRRLRRTLEATASLVESRRSRQIAVPACT